jgi:hypothetical protein
LISITGCGGSGGGGGSDQTTNNKAQGYFNDISLVADAVDGALAKYMNPSIVIPSTNSSLIAKSSQTKQPTWSGPDTDGWYTYTSTILSSTAIYKVRCVNGDPNNLQMQKDVTIVLTFNGETNTNHTRIMISAAKGSNGLWAGQYTIDLEIESTTSLGTTLSKWKHNFSDINTINACGTYDGWLEISKDGVVTAPNREFTQFSATLTQNTPPVYVKGWFQSESNGEYTTYDCNGYQPIYTPVAEVIPVL